MRRLTPIAAAAACLLAARAHGAEPPARPAPFAKGADVGWLAQMEATGYRFYDASGRHEDCLRILKNNGINAIRLRVFVDPSPDPQSGHCSPAEVADMAVRAKGLGLRVMIDFHYSDTWADPAKQAKPAAWAGHSFDQLLGDVYAHTFAVLSALKAHGVVPEWVQVGNEISGGLLWPDGSARDWSRLAPLLNRGYDAAKAVAPSIKVVIHLDRGNDGARFRDFFDNFRERGGRWDVIGMSYYPWWEKKAYTETIDALRDNLADMASRYGKEVMVCEVGGEAAQPQDTYAMLVAVQKAVRAVPDGRGLGVFYWEPEGAASWSHYPLSCWGPDGRPTLALSAFR